MAVCWNVWTGTQLSGGCFSSGLGWTRSTTCALFAKTTGSHCLDYSGCIYQLLFTFNQEPILLCSCPTKTSFLVATNIFWYLDLICGFRKEMQTRMWIYSLDSLSRLNCLPSICHESTAMLESIAAEWHQFSSKLYFCATILHYFWLISKGISVETNMKNDQPDHAGHWHYNGLAYISSTVGFNIFLLN